MKDIKFINKEIDGLDKGTRKWRREHREHPDSEYEDYDEWSWRRIEEKKSEVDTRFKDADDLIQESLQIMEEERMK